MVSEIPNGDAAEGREVGRIPTGGTGGLLAVRGCAVGGGG